MNDPLLVVLKLEALAKLAITAESEFEKAAIYGATRALIADLNSHVEANGHTFDCAEKIENVRGSICAILGYDITNGHDKDKHLGWASSALVYLRNQLKKY